MIGNLIRSGLHMCYSVLSAYPLNMKDHDYNNENQTSAKTLESLWTFLKSISSELQHFRVFFLDLWKWNFYENG